jgi:hypothetical protein
MALPGRIARSLRGWPGNRARLRRKLAGIERGLATEARLASMFAMFNALTRGERPSGAEPFPSPARALWLSTRWLTRTVALLAMAAIIFGGLLLSSMVRPVDRSCLMLTANGRPVTLPVAAPVAVGAVGPSGVSGTAGRPAPGSTGHESGCPAYPAK